MEPETAVPERVRSEEGITFERFEHGRLTAASTEPSVTIQKRGVFTLNRGSADILGYPEAIEIMYAAPERMIGLRAADSSSPYSYKMTRQPKGATFEVSAKSFLNYHRIQLETSRRWPARKSGDMLLVDLKEASIEVSLPRVRKHGKSGDELPNAR